MGTIIVILVLVIVAFFALKSSFGHFKGEGDCCGGTSISYETKQLNQILDQRYVHVLGIHCQNCENKIKNAINKIPYLSCNEIKDQKIVFVQSNQIIKDNEIKEIIEQAGYKVDFIEK